MTPPLGDELRRTARRVGAGFLGLALVSCVLVVFGALVRANGAGLACPDWPLCFGRVVPVLNFMIGLEWGHRALAGSVSLGLLGLSIALLRHPALRDRAGKSLALVWGLLGVQVVLGGLTVLLGLAPWTVTGHLLVGTSFCAALLWLSRDLAEAARSEVPEHVPFSAGVTTGVGVCTALVALQIGLGGMVSSHYAGLACAAFPTCDGESLVPGFSGLVGLHVLHRLNAVATLAAFLGLCWVAQRGGTTWRLGRLGLRLVLLQIAVGATDVLLKLPVEITALHTALALAISLVTMFLVREAVRGRSPAARPLQTGEALEAMG